MENALEWIWFQEAIGQGSIKADRVIRELGTPKRLLEMTPEELFAEGYFTQREAERIKNHPWDNARCILEQSKRYGVTFLTPDHPNYPASLTQIDAMPCVLYVLGNGQIFKDRFILTMVGARNASDSGIKAARLLSMELAAVGCTIASGLAVGIDGTCHKGTMDAGGKTVGFMAYGLDANYPAENRELKKRILKEGGALVSEYPFGSSRGRGHFNVRNRLLSGVARGVVVVEAGEHSGSLITARYALEQNRDVFALPGSIFDKHMVGCNALIRDGAKIVLNTYSILEEYLDRLPEGTTPSGVVSRIKAATLHSKEGKESSLQELEKKDTKGHKMPQISASVEPSAPPPNLEDLALSENARQVYAALERTPATGEAIAARSKLPVMAVMAAMTELELAGLAQSHAGQRYSTIAPALTH